MRKTRTAQLEIKKTKAVIKCYSYGNKNVTITSYISANKLKVQNISSSSPLTGDRSAEEDEEEGEGGEPGTQCGYPLRAAATAIVAALVADATHSTAASAIVATVVADADATHSTAGTALVADADATAVVATNGDVAARVADADATAVALFSAADAAVADVETTAVGCGDAVRGSGSGSVSTALHGSADLIVGSSTASFGEVVFRALVVTFMINIFTVDDYMFRTARFSDDVVSALVITSVLISAVVVCTAINVFSRAFVDAFIVGASKAVIINTIADPTNNRISAADTFP